MIRASSNREGEASPLVRRAIWVIVIAIALVGIGLALRLRAGLGDFWLDEIMSWGLARTAKSPWAIFQQRVDNNHLLNTLLMYCMGDQRWWPVYRIPAMLAGAGTIVVGGVIGRRWGRTEAVLAMLLLCLSYPLIHYGSEARGYSLAILFSVSAFLCMDHILERQRIMTAVLFWIACILGLLAHPLFVQVYLALLGWSAYRIARSSNDLKSRVMTVAQCHIVPLVAIAVLYASFLRGMTVVGGEITPVWEIVARSASLTLGVPARSATAWTVIASMIAAAVLGWGLFLLWRLRDDRWVFFALAIVIAPAGIILVRRPDVLYERYFLLPLTFFVLLLAYVLARTMRAGRIGAIMSVIAIASLMISNGEHTGRLIREGRGHYLEALTFIRDHTSDPSISVTSDHDFRNRLLLEFYWRYASDGRSIQYVHSDQAQVQGAQWLIVHEFDPDAVPYSEWMDHGGHRYELKASYGYAGLSGWQWFIYRNSDWENPTPPDRAP